nr:tetratricopeptide repeat protein [Candidatus Peribacteraceae bacterium]
VLLLTVAIGVVTYATRFFLAEVAFTKASRTSTVEETAAPLAKAISYRSSYMPYRLASATLSLQQARIESQKAVPNPDQVASHLSAAINEAKIVTQKDPFGVDGWNMLALLYMNAGSFTADAQGWAESALQKALTLEPSNANATLQLAIVEQSMNKMKEAETAYRDAINKQPDLVPAYTGLTDLYESQQRIDDAVALYEQMAGSIQNNPELLYQWGRVSYNRKKADDEARAEQLWLRAVELQPGFSNALYSLGLLYEKEGDKAKAREYYQKVSALNPNNEDVKMKLRNL